VSNGNAATGAQHGSGYDGLAANSNTTSTAYVISVADMLNLVKEESGDGLFLMTRLRAICACNMRAIAQSCHQKDR
jgi:hypothetical protein